MIQLYCGEGKGKTTAAIGAVIRAVGRERRVLFAQLMKGAESGEISVLKRLPQVRVLRPNRKDGFFSSMSESDRRELRKVQDEMLDEILRALKNGEADFVVLDEITHACRYGMVAKERLWEIIKYVKENEKQEMELVLTGRGPEADLEEACDYVSRIACVRHPFEKGVTARIGVEY